MYKKTHDDMHSKTHSAVGLDNYMSWEYRL